MHAKGEFTVSSWEQTEFDGVMHGQPIMRVSAVFAATGEISGTFSVAYLMYYQSDDPENPHNAQARYTGYLVFYGEMHGKCGTFAVEDRGTYTPSGPASELTVVEGSGTGEFSGITGAGRYWADGGKMVLELEYDFPV